MVSQINAAMHDRSFHQAKKLIPCLLLESVMTLTTGRRVFYCPNALWLSFPRGRKAPETVLRLIMRWCFVVLVQCLSALRARYDMSSSHDPSVDKAVSKSGRHIALHPLAIVTMCDHCTRVKVGGSRQDPESRILGLLLGYQDGLQVSITDAVELRYELGDGNVIRINTDEVKTYIRERKELFSAVYTNMEIMGWYSVGSAIQPGDLDIQRAMGEWNESPIYMLLNASAVSGAVTCRRKDLPLTLYESELHVVDDVPTMLFVSVPFQLETAQAERVSVEHVVRATPTEGESSVDLHINSVTTSVNALISRVRSIVKFLDATKQGSIPPDYRLLRQVASLCSELPVKSPGDGAFMEAVVGEYNDSLVVTYLAAVTKLSALSSEVAEKFSQAYGHDRRLRIPR